MFQYLAIDWGEKRCGLAFGDEDTGLVIGYGKDCPTEKIMEILYEETHKRKIEKFVLGIPSNFKLQKTLVSEKIINFKSELEKAFPSLQIYLINERFSTKFAKQTFGKNISKVDLNHQAACNILKDFFVGLK